MATHYSDKAIEEIYSRVRPLTEEQADIEDSVLTHSLWEHPVEGGMSHVGWGGRTRIVRGRMIPLGIGIDNGRAMHRWGFRRAVYDFCFGYVSGFAVKDILYFVWTRSLNPRKRPTYKRKD